MINFPEGWEFFGKIDFAFGSHVNVCLASLIV